MASFEEIVAGLEAEWDQGEAEELSAEIADRIRGERARTTMVERLAPVVGHPVVLGLTGGLSLRGVLRGLGPDWLLVREDGGAESVVPIGALIWVEGLSRASAPLTGVVAARTRLAMVLRRLVADRAAVVVSCADGSVLNGVLDRVGVDYAELALVAAGEFRRTGAVRSVRAIPFSAIVQVGRA